MVQRLNVVSPKVSCFCPNCQSLIQRRGKFIWADVAPDGDIQLKFNCGTCGQGSVFKIKPTVEANPLDEVEPVEKPKVSTATRPVGQIKKNKVKHPQDGSTEPKVYKDVS